MDVNLLSLIGTICWNQRHDLQR